MMSNQKTIFTTIPLVICCFAIFSVAEAVVPPPDGGYPGGNTAEGQKALLSLTTGTYNTAIGYLSLRSNTEGGFNTGVGAGALLSNNSGLNTAIGAGSLLINTVGDSNTATGAFALFSNTEGNANTASGDRALFNNTTGTSNTANGFQALYSNTSGFFNTANGLQALYSNTIGDRGTANGYQALFSNTTGQYNTANGYQALFSNTTGFRNTANGFEALLNNTNGQNNTAIGSDALASNMGGLSNTAVGVSALELSTGHENAALGFLAGVNVTTASAVICIGTAGANVSQSCYIGQIWNQPGGSQAVYVNSDGKLGAQVSARRFKDEIRPMDDASKVIYGLKPISFRYKPEIEPTRPVGFGLIAEEVEAVSPHLVTCDKNGNANSVRYDAVNAMLLNEFLKEHKKVEEQAWEIQKQEATITELKHEVKTVFGRLKEQDSKIERVSGQIHLVGPVPQVAASDQ